MTANGQTLNAAAYGQLVYGQIEAVEFKCMLAEWVGSCIGQLK